MFVNFFMDFAWFLVPNLCQKFQIFPDFREEIAGISLINFRKFGRNFGTRYGTKSIKPSKDSYYSLESNKTLSHKIDSFGRLPGDDERHPNVNKYV